MSKFDEIMKRSGYSRATVSRVINRSPHVSDEARRVITEIMKEAGLHTEPKCGIFVYRTDETDRDRNGHD
ncbi:LacI family DNA-binding transcriptional regulator [Paenibacillus amylolyticus]|uniref:LacI family DNA-binding transcriptional regulator n=1 Tax=Paenibacillus amylolyticus TaxID=1451 RepID=UPI003EB7020E